MFRFVFSREPRGKPVTELPAGYEPNETISGSFPFARSALLQSRNCRENQASWLC